MGKKLGSSFVYVIALLGLTGCPPNNAELTSGEYIVFFSESSSRTILFDSIDFESLGSETYRIDCSCELVGVSGDEATCPGRDAFTEPGCTTCEEFLVDDELGELIYPDDDVLTNMCFTGGHYIYDPGLDTDGNGHPDIIQWNPNPFYQAPGDADAGANVYSNSCAECHGDDGEGTTEGPVLTTTAMGWSDDEIRDLAANGVVEVDDDGTETEVHESAGVTNESDADDLVSYLRQEFGAPGAPAFAYESWLHRDSFQVMQQQLDPWRGEAIITTEGDFQITFHHKVGGEDFRFAFVIDPDFQPQECVGEGDQTFAEDVDGNWLENWSTDEADDAGGTLYFLNTFAYQFNPSDLEDAWFLPQDWLAGYGEAKLGEEDFFIRSARYGDPVAYSEYEALGDLFGQVFVTVEDLFYIALDADDDPLTADKDENKIPDFEEMREQMADVVNQTSFEYETLAYEATPIAHANDWRPPDGLPDGLDGWGEMHYNWVRIDDGSKLEVDGAASGEFHLLMGSTDSQSRVLVRGEFKVDKIKKERWGTRDIEAEKLEENGTVLCVDHT